MKIGGFFTQKTNSKSRFSPGWISTMSVSSKFRIFIVLIIVILLVELGNFYFSMKLMSGIRTWIAAEDIWSKHQKLMSYSLYKYSSTHNESDYLDIFTLLGPYEGDRHARLEMEKPEPNYVIASNEFISGGMHPSDTGDAIFLFRWFRKVSFVDKAVEYWTNADVKIEDFLDVARSIRDTILIVTSTNDPTVRSNGIERIAALTSEAEKIDNQLTELERNFASVLGEGSRAIKTILLTVTTILTLLLGIFCISIARLIQRASVDAVESKAEFISITSHQLRSPISQVRWALESLKDAPLSKNHVGILDTAYEATLRMMKTVQKMLMISRMEHSSQMQQMKECSLREVVEKVTKLLEGDRREKSLILDMQCDPQISIVSDEQLLIEIFQNLLSNAYAYTPPGGYVSVRVKRESMAMVRVEVTDTGYGIPRKEQRNIARKFFRASNVTKAGESGTGIGLYMAYNRVRMLGGTISFVSEENKGTTFIVRIPTKPPLVRK